MSERWNIFRDGTREMQGWESEGLPVPIEPFCNGIEARTDFRSALQLLESLGVYTGAWKCTSSQHIPSGMVDKWVDYKATKTGLIGVYEN